MELKWLEDFLSLARTRSFSRAAEERHVTQSAFSRRIQALEQWLGVLLIDRSTYPTTLTEEGRQFMETAEETARMLHASRLRLQARSRFDTQLVSIAALHTLALTFFPPWFKRVERHVGPASSRLLPDDFHNCLQALVEGSYDFLLTFHHPQMPVPLDAALYPHLVVGQDSLAALRSPALEADAAGAMPLLGYAPNSFLGRVTAYAQSQPGAPPVCAAHVNENAMAEALKQMAIEGHGLAWLPKSLAARELAEGTLIAMSDGIPLEIRLYRSARRNRAAVERIWKSAELIAAETYAIPE